MKATFDQHIGVFEDAVPKEWCNNLIDIFEKNIDKANDRKDKHPTITEDIFFGLQLIEEGKYVSLCQEFADNFWKFIYPQYEKKYKLSELFTTVPLIIDDFKLQKTLPTQGYHVWHIENDPYSLQTVNRVMVYTLYLNDVEEGGETEFLIQGKRVKPKQGTVCIFPSYYTHIHRGNPPLSGEKYIMTGWILHQSNPSLT